MKNILLVGNGFDLAHGLLTKYGDFLYLMKNWDEFYTAFENERNGISITDLGVQLIFKEGAKYLNPFGKYTMNIADIDKDNIDRLGKIIKNNSWAHYYCECEAEIEGWIDFEKEIYPVIDMFEWVFGLDYSVSGTTKVRYAESDINKGNIDLQKLRIAELWKKYINAIYSDSIMIAENFSSKIYGVSKKRILEDLRKEFDEFIEAFELYLHEFVHKRRDINILKQIKEIEIDSVISFNYTLTERLYGVKEEDVHHIHGMIRDDLSQGKNNMVMGVNEAKKQNIDFVYFAKYFQRIKKSSGNKYKKLMLKGTLDYEVTPPKFNLHIYGHSLDETDEDILKYIMGETADNGGRNMRPQKILIYYKDSTDYEQKVINLIKLYGRSAVEECLENEKIEFIPTSDEIFKG